MISFLEAAGAAANLNGMTDRQRYYDALMFRAWLRPERVGLESRYGSRADATKHTESALIDSELVHEDSVRQLNAAMVDDLLAFNYGPEARGVGLHRRRRRCSRRSGICSGSCSRRCGEIPGS